MTPATLLQAQGLTASYGDFQALFGVDLTLYEGETLAVIGANGAGKTTLLRALAGVVPCAKSMVRLNGAAVGGASPPEMLQRGLAMVPEGRKLFPSLTVEENLLVGADRTRAPGPWELESVYRLFPVLRERRRNPGTALSGGQQQMVAIGRALMSNPRVLLCDEISLGLAPLVIRDIYAAFPLIKAAGASLVVVEQDVSRALNAADRFLCLMEGRVTLAGRPADTPRESIHAAYFGAPA